MTLKHIPIMRACFDRLGVKLDIDAFDSRLIAQKVVYLLGELGVPLGYRGTFGFYIRGTYSPSLTRDLYAGKAEGKFKGRVPKLTSAQAKAVDRLKAAVDMRPLRLEVVAAYHFLRHVSGLPTHDAFLRLKAEKPHIPDQDIVIGVSDCKGLFVEVTEAEIDALNEEMAAWDRASSWEHF